MANLTEFNKLKQYLKDKDYNYNVVENYSDKPLNEWHQIIVKGTKNNPLWDVICHYGSYGYERGLLEVSGDIVEKPEDGYCLTADAVIKLLEAKNDK